jgi:riboflavin synthase
MFTGLVQGVGRVVDVQRLAADGGVRLTIDGSAVAGFRPAVGDSIALNGACMTATSVDGARFTVDVSRESLSKTAGLDGAGDVNIETSMALGDKLGGHLVAGHVDGVGEVVRFDPVHESWELVVRAPRELAKYFAYKGSVAVNGVSLTVNSVTDTPAGCEFSINIIPHTFEVTTLRSLRPGSRVNLEADLIARYVERMLSLERAG